MSFGECVVLISYAGMVGGLLVAQARGDKHLLVPIAIINAIAAILLVTIARLVS